MMSTYSWHEISDVPAKPGIYAWYYSPEITSFDLDCIIEEVAAIKAQLGPLRAKEVIQDFLERNIFRYFCEQPFVAQLRGPLKPRYEGLVEHQPLISQSLINRLVEDPRRLTTVKEIIEKSAPLFASPIYIGMSETLRRRLQKHKNLIENYNGRQSKALDEAEERDHSFAQEVRSRGIPPPRLFVVTQVVEGVSDAYVDVENILNRIHYPLFGRN